jgi:hypothetical protein
VDINASGDIARYFIDSSNLPHSFLRNSAGVLTVLDVPGAGTGIYQGTLARGINSSGTIIGSFTVPPSGVSLPPQGPISWGYLRAPDGTFTPFDVPFNFPYALSTYPSGINDSGTVVGNFINGTQIHGFTYTPNALLGTYTEFDPPGGNGGASVQAFGCWINAGGTIAGTFPDTSSVWHSFLRAADGTLTTLDAPGEGTNLNAQIVACEKLRPRVGSGQSSTTNSSPAD